MVKDLLFGAIAEHSVKFADLRFTDTLGVEQHLTIPISQIQADFLEKGKYFNESAMILMPDLYETQTLHLDPFYQDNTLVLRCNVYDPLSNAAYENCSRSHALRAEKYLQSTGIADYAYFGLEPTFYLFDEVRFETTVNRVFYEVNAESAGWNSGSRIEGGNTGHRPSMKGSHFPLPPVDVFQDLRSTIALTLESLNIPIEAHHLAKGNQCALSIGNAALTAAADKLQVLKYVVKNVAHNFGKTATFMPKPLVGGNSNSMHCFQSLLKDGVDLFCGTASGGLSELALYYIGGIMKHAGALNVLTNQTTNSYRRVVPSSLIGYSKRDRSGAIRIPFPAKYQQIEVCFPDAVSNPYLAFSAMLLAGLDGIQNKIDPGQAYEDLSKEALQDTPKVCASLEEAVLALEADHAFLLKGNVFSADFLRSIIALRKAEIDLVRSKIHPVEFELCYSS